MKNKLAVFILIITLATFTLLTSSCAKNINIVENQDIIEKVIELEKNEYLLKTVQISYNEYLKNVNPLIFTNSSYLDKNNSEELIVYVKNIYNFKVINKSEILNANKDELQMLRDKLVPPELVIPIDATMKYEPIKISKVYNNEVMKGKIVFVTQLINASDKESDIMYYRSYIFRRDNNEWKLFDTRNSAIRDFDNGKGGFNVGGINKTDIYEKFNGEEVIYDTSISVDQYDLK